MKRSLRALALVALSPLLMVGCKKKEASVAEVAQEAEAKLPLAEQSPDIASPAEPATPGEAPAVAASPDMAASPAKTAAAPAGGEQAAYEAWFKNYNLDLNEPKMLDADPDEDGYTNRDEFLADTNPHDKNSRPGIHKSIRMKEYADVRLPLALESIDGEKAVIKRTDQPSAKPITVKAGDSIKGLPLTVTRVETKQDFDKGGERVDLSNVAFEDSSTKEKIVLRKDLPARTSASYAVLASPDGKTTLKVHQGETFSWPTDGGTSFKVLDLSQDQAVLFEIDAKKTWTILRQ